jgi:large subunit ribosomal protein L25
VMISVNDSDLKGILRDTSSENIILTLQIESDKGKDVRTVMLKELQAHPFKPILFHADFYEVSMDKELTVDIPIHLVNTPEGVATKGGVLQQIRRELNVSALPSKLVDFIEVDVSGLDIGDAVHAGDLHLPEGIQSNEEDDLTIAVVSAPTVEAEEVAEEEVEEEMAEAAEAEAETEE